MTRSKFIICTTLSAILVIGSNIKHTSAQLKKDKISFTEAFSEDNIYDSNNPQLSELDSALFSISKDNKRERIRGSNIVIGLGAASIIGGLLLLNEAEKSGILGVDIS